VVTLLLDSKKPEIEQHYDIPDFPKLRAKNIEGLPPLPLNNAQWREWEQYVLLHRAKVREETEEPWSGQEKARAQEIVRVHKDGRYWLSTYGAIYQAKEKQKEEVRETWGEGEEDKPSGWVLPFTPYVFQLYFWDFQDLAMRTIGPKGDVLVIKTRQMGMSNTAISFMLWAWMVKKPYQGRLLSRKEDLVDEANNPDSLFWKARLNLYGQPKWLLKAFAPNFDPSIDDMTASLTNPDTFNHLAGESTNATAGRGGTATQALLDEFGFMRGGGGVWTALRSATDHRTAISTVALKYGSHLYDLSRLPPEDAPATIWIPWYLHPDHDDAWLERERKRDTEAGIQTEVLMNFFGDESDFVYPELGKKEVGDFPYEPYAGPVFVAIDDGWSGYWAFHIIQYITQTGRHRMVDSYRNQHHPVDFYGSLFRSTYLDGFHYGPHEDAIMALFRYIQQPIYIMDTHGKHVEQVAGMSVIERLASRWGIYANVDYEKREEKDRQEYARRIIPFTDFNNTPRVEAALLSMKRYKWKEIDEGSEFVTEFKSPVKNHDSHDPTAYEYYATNFDQFKMMYLPGQSIVYEGE
jgi:hypothetical protein